MLGLCRKRAHNEHVSILQIFIAKHLVIGNCEQRSQVWKEVSSYTMHMDAVVRWDWSGIRKVLQL